MKGAIKDAKGKVQEALKPGKVPGGSSEENLGVAYEFPDAKVPSLWGGWLMGWVVCVSGGEVNFFNLEASPSLKGYGGTTTTAQTARTVFQSSILRQRLVDLCPSQYQQAVSQVLLNNLTLLSIMSCDKLVDVSKVGEYYFLICNDNTL